MGNGVRVFQELGSLVRLGQMTGKGGRGLVVQPSLERERPGAALGLQVRQRRAKGDQGVGGGGQAGQEVGQAAALVPAGQRPGLPPRHGG